MSASGVFTRMKRVTFVEKTSGEVGDGTAWPLLVTRDELAEIYYRVKDATFTAGSFTVEDTTSSDTYTVAVQGSPGSVLVETGGTYSNTITGRGFFALAPDDTEPLPDAPAARFGTSYEVTAPSFNTVTIRDIADDERAIWEQKGIFWDEATMGIGLLSFSGISEPSPLRTAFDLVSAAQNDEPGSMYGIFGKAGDYSFISEAGLNISGEVAWVDVDASGNPFSPGNELWIGLKFEVYYVATPASPLILLSTDHAFFGAESYSDAGIDLRIELASTTLTANIYFFVEYVPDFTTSGADFVIEANVWWPYAKPGGAVWNATTGVKL